MKLKIFVDLTTHYKMFNTWVSSLEEMSEEEWFKPIASEKWSIAEIISHLIAWDHFTIEEILAKLVPNVKLNPFPDFQIFNNNAAQYAKNGISKEQLINEFLVIRTKLVKETQAFFDIENKFSFYIGDQSFTIVSYIEDVICHDLHHMEQIQNVYKVGFKE